MTMLQVEGEIAALAALFAREGVRSYLEIGSMSGGSLEVVAAALPRGSRIVSVDMPKGSKAAESSRSLYALVRRLNETGYQANVILGDSQDKGTVEVARRLGPFDAVLIDADHRLAGVTADWTNYGPMGRMVAFHDIAWRRAPGWQGGTIDVPQLWESLKGGYRHQEFRFCPTGENNGIGVLWK